MRQRHRAGEKLLIHYCGPTVPIVDAPIGEFRRARVFVAVLGASKEANAEATSTQAPRDWIASRQRAFRFLGVSVELLVHDFVPGSRTGHSLPRHPAEISEYVPIADNQRLCLHRLNALQMQPAAAVE